MSKVGAVLLTGAVVALVFIGVRVIRSISSSPAESALQKADSLWETSDREDAAKAYMVIVLDGLADKLPPSEQVRVFSRIVDGLAEIQPELAMEFAKRARYTVGGVLSVKTLEAERVLDRERRIAEAERRQTQANWDAYGEKLAAEKQAHQASR